MRIQTIAISLNDLQEALTDWAAKKGAGQPDEVLVESHGKAVITIELRPGGLVEAYHFKHRSDLPTD